MHDSLGIQSQQPSPHRMGAIVGHELPESYQADCLISGVTNAGTEVDPIMINRVSGTF